MLLLSLATLLNNVHDNLATSSLESLDKSHRSPTSIQQHPWSNPLCLSTSDSCDVMFHYDPCLPSAVAWCKCFTCSNLTWKSSSLEGDIALGQMLQPNLQHWPRERTRCAATVCRTLEYGSRHCGKEWCPHDRIN